jgi:hypothetical protein
MCWDALVTASVAKFSMIITPATTEPLLAFVSANVAKKTLEQLPYPTSKLATLEIPFTMGEPSTKIIWIATS